VLGGGTAGRLVELAGRLIEARSENPPGDERAVAEVVRQALAERGLPAPEVLGAAPERPSLLATLDFGPGGRHLCLCGHLDTKPAGDGWTRDPFHPVVIDGHLHGLGACDMKGALAAVIEAAGDLAAQPPPRGRLSLLFLADEERGGACGARLVAESGRLAADAIVLAEPGGMDADWDHLHLVSRGIARFWARVRGDQGHSSLSDRRRLTSATEEAAHLLLAFRDLRPRAAERALPGWRVTVNPGVLVTGGIDFGVVPGRADLAVEVRSVPGMTRRDLERDLTVFLAARRGERPGLRAELAFEPPPRDWLPPTEVAADHPVVGCLEVALERAVGRRPPRAVFPGTTDAAWLQGRAGIPTLPAAGPGLLERAHTADEWVSVAALEQAVGVYRLLARSYCAGDG
jgi:succinyl-diaminopimelate desuccinylase